MLCISLSAVFIKKVDNFNKTLLKHMEYAESEFRTFDFVICKFIVVYMNTDIYILRTGQLKFFYSSNFLLSEIRTFSIFVRFFV